MNRELVAGTMLGALSVAYAGLALLLPRHSAPGPGPAFLPLLIAAALFVVAAAFVRDGWNALPEEVQRTRSAAVRSRKSVQALLLCAAYVPAFYVLGFVGSTAALALLFARLFGERRWSVLVSLAVAVPLLLLLLFGAVLGVRFPVRPPVF